MNKNHGEENILTQKGFKNTKGRKAIIDVLEKVEMPVSAEEIFLKLKDMGVSTNLSTVYRTLELLETKGLVSKSLINEGKARFELTGEGHRHHLVCTECQKIISIDTCPIEQLENEVGKETKFCITGHRLELFGICPECQKK